MDSDPLVSIAVITYNSSSYILEGLESIKSQTYRNIELIISDDCSNDNTVEICKKWIDNNRGYFIRTEIVTSEKNTGVAGNLNRAIDVCHGEWIKTLSGDDKFSPLSIEKYLKFTIDHPQADVIFGKFYFYGPDLDFVEKNKYVYENKYYPKIKLNQNKQFRENLKGLFVPGPGLFYKKNVWIEVGGFDERYQFCEEDPFMFKIYNSNRKVFFLNDEVYEYQVLPDSLGHEVQEKISRHETDRIRFFRDIRRAEMVRSGLIIYAIEESILYKIREAQSSKKRILFYWYRFLHWFSPLNVLEKFNFLFSILIKSLIKCTNISSSS